MKFCWRRAVFSGALALFVLGLAGCEQQQTRFNLLVSTEEPANTIAEALAPMLDEAGLALLVEERKTPSDVLAAMAEGLADLAIVEESASTRSRLRTVMPLYPSVLHALHSQSYAPRNFGELVRGRKVYAGPAGSAARRLLADLGSDFGLSTRDYTLLDDPWSVEPEAYFIFGGLLAPESVAALASYRLFSFGDPQQLGAGTVAEGIALKHRGKRVFVLPASIYGELNPEPILTIATRTVLLAPPSLDDDAAYAIAEQLVANAQALSNYYPLLTQELHTAFDPGMLALPLHPGARRFINRDEPSFFEENTDIFALSFTLFAALTSALIALYRARKQRKKDRVDVYYRQIIDLRKRMEGRTSLEELQAVAAGVREVQEEVFGLLIDERLNADDTLTLFLDLSNQVLKECEGEEQVAAAQ